MSFRPIKAQYIFALAFVLTLGLTAPTLALAFYGNKVPVALPEGSYHHFNVQKLKSELSKSDLITLRVENTGKRAATFFLVFEDHNSSDYWSRLNFKTTLAPGTNNITFNLRRALGERGSVKHERGLDFERLKKMYVAVNPEGMEKADGSFHLRDIGLEMAKKIRAPEDARFFDFAGVDMPSSGIKGAQVVTENTKYNAKAGYGFSYIDLWNARDAAIKPDYLSSSLGVNKAAFKVKLPPGEYKYELIWDELGYWDTPFWSDRTFYIDGSPERKETRTSTRDFLRDYLSLLEEPPAGADIYGFYFDKIFRPVQGAFTVKNGHVEFTFEGDATGASLNSLLIWPISKNKEVDKFKRELRQYSKASFDQKYRLVGNGKHSSGSLKATFVGAGKSLRAGEKCEGERDKKLVGAKNGFFATQICFNANPESPVTYEVTDLVDGNNKIPKERIKLGLLRYRAKAIDLNHETYELRVDQLEPLLHPSIELNGYSTRYINLSIHEKDLSPGAYKGTLKLEQDGKEANLQLNLVVLKANYEELPIKAGFIGLNPFPNTHFPAKDKAATSLRYRKNALSALKSSGFNLFTDLPEPEILYKGAAKKSFELKSDALDEFLEEVEGREVFMYDGSFPRDFFTGHQRNAGQTEESFWKNLTKEFEKWNKSHKGKDFVYLYSDEATGYRDAVEEDLQKLKEFRKVFPSMKFGGFGNLYTWAEGKKLYKNWDYGLYSEIPGEERFKKLKAVGQKIGVYNLCAEPTADLSFCFGPLLYRLGSSGISRYFEWHASAIHNYPGFDLDGREADIALFYPSIDGEVSITKRFLDASIGLQSAKKFGLLEKYLNERKAPGHKDNMAMKWLKKIKSRKLFPIKDYRQNYVASVHSYEKDLKKLDKFLETFLSK